MTIAKRFESRNYNAFMKIRFYFDPICPWCWITSRWMTEVQKERDLQVEFCSFSLAVKNNLLDENSDSEYAPMARITHKILRIVEKIKQDNPDNATELVAAFYAYIGNKIHVQGETETDHAVEVLESIGLDSSYADAQEDSSYDKEIKASMDLAMKSVGNDVGVPIMILETDDGDRGFFGPVISELPSADDGKKLFDAIASMISLPGFYELKRTREISPNTASTARLFDSQAIDGIEGEACSIG